MARMQKARKAPTRASRRVLDDHQYRILAQFRAALRRFLAFSESATAASGVTAQQYQALLAIRAAGAAHVSIGDLADELLLKHNGAVQLVDRLVAGGLVRRTHMASDGRVVTLELTPEGGKKVADLALQHFHDIGRRRPQLAELVKMLAKMRGR